MLYCNSIMRQPLFLGILTLFFVFTPFAFASGGPVSLMAFPQRPFADTKTYILQTDVYTEQPCSDIKPTVSFQDSIDGDSITPFTPPSDGTYFTAHYNTGQPKFAWKEVCTTYFQAKSGAAKQRTAVVKVRVDGVGEQRDTLIAYGDDASSKELQSFGRVNDYDNTPQVDVISEKPLGEFKREFSLQWQKIPWATQYSVFAKQVTNDGSVVPIGSFGTTADTYTTLILPKDNDFYISVMACKPDQDCNTQRDDLYDYLIEKSHIGSAHMTRAQAVGKTLPTNDKVDALNKKVAALENKLEESNKKQTVLEEKLTQLVNFIRSLFPNFK